MSLKKIHISLLTFLCICLFASSSKAFDTRDEQHIGVSIRMIGHQVLLNSHDSTSRVLPIKKENGRYRIQFDADFAFVPEELVATVGQVVEESGIAKGYIVEVEKCENGEVIYSYQIGNMEKPDIIPCKSRSQPKACYSLLITLLNPAKPMEFWQTYNPVGPTGVTSTQPAPGAYALIALLMVSIMGGFIFLQKKKRKTITDPNMITLGGYQFDKINSALLFNNQTTELTAKEADLLILLHASANSTVEREVMLQKVWGDEGDYVGRTLDVFISKLRKKLQADASVKIVNTRGVGYKLVLNELS